MSTIVGRHSSGLLFVANFAKLQPPSKKSALIGAICGFFGFLDSVFGPPRHYNIFAANANFYCNFADVFATMQQKSFVLFFRSNDHGLDHAFF
ncbi:MAG: hypothetical protein A2W80_13150 [Candidatus Riflebacteria bacterium GWC2_50_8]|nr:MAG: hypothetical protein A2W80_13150 [Candidatus Riflebacteria bacterium GWC2_50_8]